MDAEFGLGLELIEDNAEEVPLPGASFDLAVSEYGASIWCDPNLWIREAAACCVAAASCCSCAAAPCRCCARPMRAAT